MSSRALLLPLVWLSAAALGADAPVDPSLADFVKRFKGKGAIGEANVTPLGPRESLAAFTVAEGLEMQLVASEPEIAQPLHLHFDERGRLWVVQYLQYPFPAGLKIVKYDQYLRAVFDTVPEPPPHGVKGADKITILEDKNGDGIFESQKDFVTGLNIATSALTGHGGVWVMNPPYLLFYPDKDRDDVPDGDPEVRLSGFGLEDTHAVANGLRWGPDGWLYGATGSTVTATVNGLHWLGQAIWRYQPDTRAFEIFAEGGGNTWGVEFDKKGRLFSGTNNSDVRGLHFVQGGYYMKNFAKHGPLTNPYAFGYFAHMTHTGAEKLTHVCQPFLVYEGAAFPPRFDGHVLTGIALSNRLQCSALPRDGSTFDTRDTEPLATSTDRWFRPVALAAGPDGAVYVADWYDIRLSHVDPRDTWDRSNGRIYRLHTQGAEPARPFDLWKADNVELLAMLSHPNKWFRETARRVLADRHEGALAPELKRMVESEHGQPALEALWALHGCGGLDDAFATRQLAHADPDVRAWSIRLVGDTRSLTPTMRDALLSLARTEPSADVRSQLASSCQRWPAADALPIVRELLVRGEDAHDPHLPLLLWWALESKAASSREEVLALLRQPALWQAPTVRGSIVSRLSQRFTAERTPESLAACAELLALAPSTEDTTALLRGMDEGLQGNAVASVPQPLSAQLAKLWDLRPHDSTLVRVALRLGHSAAADTALRQLADAAIPEAERKKLTALLAEQSVAAAIPVLLDRFAQEKSESFRLDLLNALQRFDDERIAAALLTAWPQLSAKLRASAAGILASRPAWAHALLRAVDAGAVKREHLAPSHLLTIRQSADAPDAALLEKHWGKLGQSTEEKQSEIARLRAVLAQGKGDEQKGRELFKTSCAVCHTLHGEGARIGPDLTSYERDNLDFLLPSIVDPNLGVREEFTTFILTTTDGQTLTGFLAENQPQSVTVVDLAQNRVVIPRERLKTLAASPVSLMPEGLLLPFSEEQVRDLFAWLTKK